MTMYSPRDIQSLIVCLRFLSPYLKGGSFSFRIFTPYVRRPFLLTYSYLLAAGLFFATITGLSTRPSRSQLASFSIFRTASHHPPAPKPLAKGFLFTRPGPHTPHPRGNPSDPNYILGKRPHESLLSGIHLPKPPNSFEATKGYKN